MRTLTLTTCSLLLMLSLTPSWTLAQDPSENPPALASNNTSSSSNSTERATPPPPSSSSSNNTQGATEEETPQNLTIITPEERRPKKPNATAPGFGDKFASSAPSSVEDSRWLLTGGFSVAVAAAAAHYYH